MKRTIDGVDIGPHSVVRYWPRVESDFALRERWQLHDRTERRFWLMHGGDGSLHVYGKTAGFTPVPIRMTHRRIARLAALRKHERPRRAHLLTSTRPMIRDPDPIARLPRPALPATGVLRQCHGQHETCTPGRCANPADLDWHFHLLFDYGERSTRR